MGKAIDTIKISKAGQELFEKILTEVHHNNEEEMFNYFRENIKHLDAYGETDKKRVLNYCTYKRDVVLHMYNVI